MPPRVMWLPPPVPPCVPSTSNDSVDKPGQPGLLVERLQLLALLGETGGGCDVDLDHPGVRGDRRRLQPWIGRRFVAFDHHRAADLRGRGLEPGNEVDEVFQRLGGRQEDVEQPVADLGDHRGDRRGR